ncbi:MAG: hypothetical protein AAGF12_21050 [Myxococcota bacterium]
MFGLGPIELLIIGAIVLAIAGPAAAPKLLKTFKSVQNAKKELTGAAGLEKLVTGELDGVRDAIMGKDGEASPSSESGTDQERG